MPSTPLEIMQADLPNMPAEIIDIWLLTHYKRFGWPPRVDNDWRYILGSGNDLSFLQRHSWQRPEIRLSPERLAPTSQEMTVDLFRTYVLGHTTFYTVIGDGPDNSAVAATM